MDYQRSPGGTLHLSPTHPQLDLHSLNSIRRSISQSPSKRLCNSRSPSLSPRSPLSSQTSAHPRSPLHRVATPSSPNTRVSQDDHALLSVKKGRPVLRRTTPLRSVQHSHPGARSPMRRALSLQSDNGNSSSSSSQPTPDECQDDILAAGALSTTPTTAPLFKQKFQDHLPASGPPMGFFAPPRSKSPTCLARMPIAKSSPLKRSDGFMNLDQPGLGSPSTKRRSLLHRNSSETSRSSSDLSGDESDENRDLEVNNAFKTPLAPRFSALKKTKRSFKKPGLSFARRALDTSSGEAGDGEATPDSSQPTATTPLRATSLFSPARTPFGEPQMPPPHFSRPTRMHPHPLSKALSPNSPTITTNLTAKDGSNDEPFPSPDEPTINFSKSLPIGALRPHPVASTRPSHGVESVRQQEVAFGTPEGYKMIRPNPAAFMSTGLISKRHRDPDNLPAPPGTGMDMPDTPIKKNPGGFAFGASPISAVKTITQPRFNQPQFGTPLRPLGSQTSRLTSASLGNSGSLFGGSSQQSTLDRRTSFISSDGEDLNRSPNAHRTYSQSSNDDMPPTPTKQGGNTPGLKQHSLRSSVLGRRPAMGPSTFMSSDHDSRTDASGKSPYSRPAAGRLNANYGRLRRRGTEATLCSPRRLKRSKLSAAYLPDAMDEVVRTDPPAETVTKTTCPSPVIQRLQQVEPRSSCPQTPLDSVDHAFPDPSNLSISGGSREPRSPRKLLSSFSNESFHAPETPSAQRDTPNFLGTHHLMMTPSHHGAPHDLDPNLLGRFKKVEWYGKGQFSDVYKVSQPRGSLSTHFLLANDSADMSSPGFDKIYIVKRSKRTVSNEMKHREVSAMRAMGKHDHIVQLFNSWEMQGHLYLQTEFCEEGSLDRFINGVGNKDRLDDFRVWKILVELSLGLKHIHDSGFVHLDLKPENVFIDFEGTLKIGDFGHASPWPTPAHLEGEGDRRYMSSELLHGAFDKPADVFALGIVIFEIACNIDLPDNGATWHQLRSGEFGGLPSLTSESTRSLFIGLSDHAMAIDNAATQWTSSESFYHPENDRNCGVEHVPHSFVHANQVGVEASSAREPPDFMKTDYHPDSLDKLVHWMMSRDASERPTVDQVLGASGCVWVNSRRRAGAVVFEGRWGPTPQKDEAMLNVDQDAEMTDAL